MTGDNESEQVSSNRGHASEKWSSRQIFRRFQKRTPAPPLTSPLIIQEDTNAPIVEVDYADIPELSADDIQEGAGFSYADGDKESRGLFIRFIGQALKNPAWVIVPINSSESQERQEKGLARAKYMSHRSTLQLLEATQGKTDEQIQATAVDLYSGRFQFASGMGVVDVVARGIELMGEAYPNLQMYRGGSYDPQDISRAKAYAPGHLPTALDFVKMRQREKPVIEMVSFKDVGKRYSTGDITLGIEGEWWRNSIDIRFNDKSKDIVKYRKPPTTVEKTQDISQQFKQKSII